MRPLLVATLTVLALALGIVSSSHAQPNPPARLSKPAATIMAGTIVGLTPDGILRTVVSVKTDPGDLVILGIRYTSENGVESGRRTPGRTPASQESQTCCDGRTPALSDRVLTCKGGWTPWWGGVYQKTSETAYWPAKADPRRVMLGDEIFRLSCG